MIKRAASEEAFPNAWELPGGHVEESDETMRHAVTREVLEETGQVVEQVVGEIDEMAWEGPTTNVQLNYVVSVRAGQDVKLNPVEHSAWLWASQGDLHDLYMTPEMRVRLEEHFCLRRSLSRLIG
ncbi:MAG: hypothetical protein M1816_004715 [Peltula sp. TS41687]|nr:MAG: hypothetical protein M1816_004715 [Peltula sp. TS41687]